MFCLNRSLSKINPNFSQIARLLCINSNIVSSELKNNYSPEQNAKILEILNESSPEDLSKYKISLARIQTLSNWKAKKGPFKSLGEVLAIGGFGENVLKQILKSIASQNDSKEIKTTNTRTNKRIKNLLVPDMDFSILSSLNSAVAIHVEPTGIAWTRLEKENNSLTSWFCKNFSSLPEKMMPLDTFNLALEVLRKTPLGDVYIFEATNNLTAQAKSKPEKVSTHNQQMELISMLLALINTSINHNISLKKCDTQEPVLGIQNRVFFLKSRTPARLFRTLIGTEKVSAVTAVNGLLHPECQPIDALPCSPVIFDQNLKRHFESQSSSNKELLAQALMLGVSFMDLYVRKMPLSYGLTSNTSRKNQYS